MYRLDVAPPSRAAEVHCRQWFLLLQLTKADYDLPTLGPKIVELGRATSLGRGFQVFRFALRSGSRLSPSLYHRFRPISRKSYWSSKRLGAGLGLLDPTIKSRGGCHSKMPQLGRTSLKHTNRSIVGSHLHPFITIAGQFQGKIQLQSYWSSNRLAAGSAGTTL